MKRKAWERFGQEIREKIALHVQCPKCNADPGDPCTKGGGKRKKATDTHVKRVDLGYGLVFRVCSSAIGRSTLSPDAALDLWEPGMDGFALRKALRVQHPEQMDGLPP